MPGNGATADTTEGPRYGTAWCEGETAIGFSRLALYALLAGQARTEVARELDSALDATQAGLTQPFGPGRGFCLCHGAAGLAELLIDAGLALNRPSLLTLAEMVAGTGLAQFHDPDNPWPSGVPVRGESPNLMLGLAGIGHFYLRLRAPEAVPSVLLVGPGAFGPRRRAEARPEDGAREEDYHRRVELGELDRGGHHVRQVIAIGTGPAFSGRGPA